MPRLDAIYVYPVKSLDGVALETAKIGPDGSLARDRQYAMVDADGEYVNGKRTPAVHRIRADFDPAGRIVTLSDRAGTARFDLERERDRARAWLDKRFEPEIELVSDDGVGFPDDTTDFGPTVVSTGTLAVVADWFDEVDGPGEMRRRLRPNLVVDAEPFWEDRLYASSDSSVRFDVGDVTLEGRGPCQRCVVPARDPDSGEEIERFRTRFVEKRRETLPAWAPQDRFDHYYRVMVNTRTPSNARSERIAVGSEVVIDDTTDR
ncbi:MOSC domain-containing protein [Halapricum desulfuricans]|uniref:Putative Fe-S protein n=1 Tax=Halapricum desulfuricans TaxID=2841257 RepID=A0A897MXR9_9EURY|nr:MOSC N-terminal beta barrel domain-containing protein [Halapricum desulfuricans]QSG05247.1 putative Fe-S protein [Halapricum desulfuricans]